jgi:rubredoxin
MKKWQCIVCGWVYDEALGDEEHGIAPGTRWADVPDDFVCPECGVPKARLCHDGSLSRSAPCFEESALAIRREN